MDENVEQSKNFEQAWDRGRDEHKQRQRERLAKLPFSEKLAWLEEAHGLVLQLQASRAQRARLDDDQGAE